VCEFAANFENLIICENINDKLIILDSLKKFSFADNNQRQIIPKMEWQAPITNFVPNTEDIADFVDIVDGKIVEGLETGLGSLNELFEKLYYEGIISKKSAELKRSLLSNLKSKLKKVLKKLKKQEIELATAQDEEKWLHYAELLKSSAHKINKGMTSISLPNYYVAGFPEIVIPLSDDKSPVENSNYYFKKYKKAKVGQKLIAEQIAKTKQEVTELENDIANIEEEENYLELVELASAKKNSKRQTDTKIHFRRLKIDDNWEIFIGRSSTENDMLTCKVAKGRDWWFHTRVFQGTHVVLRNYANKQLPDKYRILCAQLAAYYSRAKKSENVPVDYTQIRFVRKPRGSAPGYVTYKNQKTLFVNPLDYRDAMEILGINNE
jgi:predicted ribosome quality control (RQC) complex YloA/Tae2 family protein